MLRKDVCFEIAFSRPAAAAVWNGSAEGALIIENARAVADKSPHCGAGRAFRFRHGQIARRAGVVKKKVVAVRSEVEQAKVGFDVLIAARFHGDRFAPK